MMLSVNIEKKLDSFKLKANFSLDNDVTALFGASGAGKSMTLKCIAGIEKPDKGYIRLGEKILFDSEKHIDLPPQKRRVGYLFQEYALFPNMTVIGNIRAGLHRLPRKEREDRAKKLIRQFHLDGLEDKRPNQISGGEKQRAALARIFASEPELLLLDEPFASLDTTLKLDLLPEIKDTIRRFDGETIFVSHQLDEVVRLCQKVVPIVSGKTEEPDEIQTFYTQMRNKYESAGMILPAYESYER